MSLTESSLWVLQAIVLVLPVVGLFVAYGISLRYPNERSRIIGIMLVVLALSALSSLLPSYVRFSSSTPWEPWTISWVAEKMTFLFIALPLWTTMAAFFMFPQEWRISRFVLAVVVGYVAMAPTLFLLFVAVCGLYGDCL